MKPAVEMKPEAAPTGALIDERALSKLRWRCRRGLLENDLFIERFFNSYSDSLTETQAEGLRVLMDLADNDLLDLLLRRKEATDELDRPDVQEVLSMLRTTTA
ncbi:MULTISPECIES: FAD assembly factor SdhE [Roseateles]|uniref:FAD assembly factor SdhE n=1 Tax=Roseateles albus TaxID=2987525 RepID=A0ABT5KH82_9BURK|nr:MULTISPECIES: succinate dehydrogenase assembly factor 2 [Roseateles]MCV2360845.1 succinate dehydrogenase assembly factor 2 [Paucibacter sp. TC2R-5]MDC8773230.1 succinate dehydrogenase assembly factor 2 [Roseateles albus]